MGPAAREAAMAETRRRMAGINRCLDLIPAHLLLGGDHPLVKQAHGGLDPEKAPATSRLLEQAAAEAGAPKKRKPGKDGPNSRGELHEKLELRLAELKEERRRQQSAADKAKAKESREATGKPEKGQRQPAHRPERHPPGTDKPPATTTPVSDGGGAEVGRLTFEAKKASLPFGADAGKRGGKVRKMRAELKRSERDAARIQKAEEQGQGQEVRTGVALQKALQRAQGLKVHDDPHKLRKAQKALEMRKKKGKDKREEQVQDTKRQQEERQQKRKENLAKRGSKKKKRRSGFEGDRDGYLNSEA
mmetsp:Transcript_21422/g.62022  ORF Transcript_21422/g.62022 Transcript_21422/m.62022 type:complete len:304 (-) Transcript_21422:142-1053(-)